MIFIIIIIIIINNNLQTWITTYITYQLNIPPSLQPNVFWFDDVTGLNHHFLATAPSPGNLLQVNCYKHKKIYFGG